MSTSLQRILLEACVLVAFGSLVGLSLNHELVLDAFAGRLVSPIRTTPAIEETRMPVPVLLDEVKQLTAAGALMVDARSPELYAEGHLPAAVSLPLIEIDDVLSAFRDKVTPEQILIIYCSGFGCPDSFDLAVRLIGEGYQDVRVFEGGFPEWRDAGLPIVTGAQ